MIARTPLAWMIVGSGLALSLATSPAVADPGHHGRKAGSVATRERTTHAAPRRGRATTARRAIRHDDGAAFVATLDVAPIAGAFCGASDCHPAQVGLASWYGGKAWQGRRMSDGSRYNENDLTAAHATLPLGSMVRVSLMDGSETVVVRITDRPGTRSRIIDLSRGAAASLGILSRGIARVRLEPL